VLEAQPAEVEGLPEDGEAGLLRKGELEQLLEVAARVLLLITASSL